LEASNPPLVFDYCASIAMFDGMISKITQHGRINDDARAITANMIQGWIREINQNFGRPSHGERLGESYTRCTAHCEIQFMKLIL
jgi:hypothetical protein